MAALRKGLGTAALGGGVVIALGRAGHAQKIIGTGEGAFAGAVAALREWRAHAAYDVRVTPAHAPIAVGTEVTVRREFGPVAVEGKCVITRVIDEPRRFGFEYEAGAGHPLHGHELFLVEWLADDRVQFTVAAESMPAWPVAWMGYPVVRWLQHRARTAFVEGMKQ